MKHKLKHAIALALFCLALSLNITSCEKEDDLKPIEENLTTEVQTQFNIKRVGKSKLNKNKTLKKQITKLSNNLIKNKIEAQHKTVIDTEYGFSINTEYASYIESEDGSYHSYTFYVEREVETDELENVLLSLQPDGTYKITVLTYNTTAQEKEDLLNGYSIDLTNKVSAVKINDEGLILNIFSKATDCSGFVVRESCDCNMHDAESGYRDCSARCYKYKRTYFGCGSPGGGASTGQGNGSGYTNNSGSTSGGTSTSTSSNNGGDVSTATGPCTKCPPIEDESQGDGDDDDDDDDCGQPPANIISELESVFGVGSVLTDCTISASDVPDELHFETKEELQAFYDSLKQAIESASFESTLLPTPNEQSNSQVSQHFKFYFIPFTVINIYIKQELGNDHVDFTDYSVLDVTSDVSGLTLFDDWTQTNVTPSMESYESKVDVYGILRLKIFFKGIGSIGGEALHFRMIMNATDGSAISQNIID